MKFSKEDVAQIEACGLTVEQVKKQLQFFVRGQIHTLLEKPAVAEDGIVRFQAYESQQLVAYFDKKKHQYGLLKFVPASGAATRMFKALIEFVNRFDPKTQTFNEYVNKNKAHALKTFQAGMEKLPFYGSVIRQLKDKYVDFDERAEDDKIILFINYLLASDGFDFQNLPKGLVPFHRYKNHLATPFEEHLFEAALYVENKHAAALHFTVSESHLQLFENLLEKIWKIVSEKTEIRFDVSFSFQKKSTDTLAVSMDNVPLRNQSGELVFRPGGHGALIENLNERTEHLIFIQNIDNVVAHQFEKEVSFYKKMLGGLLIKLQKQCFAYLVDLEKPLDEAKLNVIKKFLVDQLNICLPIDFEKYTFENKASYIQAKLNRPIRVCGMVRNEGEPGGGPFWVKDASGNLSLQIVESAQVNKKNKQQEEILNRATHFNPVDIVCGVYDYLGNKFDLTKFVDEKAVFIAEKTVGDQSIKALELPGLWNGGMAYWNTIFVEVPLITFNPVKTVNDLFKPAHQAK